MSNYISIKSKMLSFTSIILVVFLHSYNLKERMLSARTLISDEKNYVSFIQFFISNGLTRIAVPMFLMLSGYLFFHSLRPSVSGFFTKYKSRARSLLVPFLIWSALSILFAYILQSSPSLSPYVPEYMKIETSPGSILHRLIWNPVAFQLWFMRSLIFIVIISPIIYILVRYLYIVPVIAAFAAFFLEIPIPYITTDALLFFTIGAFLAIHKINIDRKANKYLGILLFAAWLILLAIKTNMSYTDIPIVNDPFNNNPFANNATAVSTTTIYILHQLSILLGCISVWSLYDVIFSRRLPGKALLNLSASTFIIFVGHEPILNILMEYLLKQRETFSYGYSFTAYLLAPSFVILLLILLNGILQKLCPGLLSVVTGSRGGSSTLNR